MERGYYLNTKEETMSKPSVIIIGAGLGGLSTGTYAQMNG
jgi:cation diffusion facilitator CzcD-associated flavoprotein CzcO